MTTTDAFYFVTQYDTGDDADFEVFPLLEQAYRLAHEWGERGDLGEVWIDMVPLHLVDAQGEDDSLYDLPAEAFTRLWEARPND